MNPSTYEEARKIYNSIKRVAPKLTKIDIVICPPYTYLKSFVKNQNEVFIGAQNVFFQEQGSYTGEIGVNMLKDLDIKYVIVGHSERRNMGETDQMISKKVQLLLDSGISPILCIGEKERMEQGEHLDYIKIQIKNSLEKVAKKNISKLIIAYEPVWAIGAKEAMNPPMIHEMMLFIRKTISDIYGHECAMSMPVLYGGSVNFRNAVDIIKEGQVDGLLVGRESMNTTGFVELLKTIDTI